MVVHGRQVNTSFWVLLLLLLLHPPRNQSVTFTRAGT
jgi:hypothetical protein